MNYTLNFNNIQKQYMKVIFPDEKQTTLLIGTPTKGMMSELLSFQNVLLTANDNNTVDVIDDLYVMCAKVMSRNKTGKKITKQMLTNLFDFEDIVVFFYSYVEFVNSLANQKN